MDNTTNKKSFSVYLRNFMSYSIIVDGFVTTSLWFVHISKKISISALAQLSLIAETSLLLKKFRFSIQTAKLISKLMSSLKSGKIRLAISLKQTMKAVTGIENYIVVSVIDKARVRALTSILLSTLDFALAPIYATINTLGDFDPETLGTLDVLTLGEMDYTEVAE